MPLVDHHIKVILFFPPLIYDQLLSSFPLAEGCKCPSLWLKVWKHCERQVSDSSFITNFQTGITRSLSHQGIQMLCLTRIRDLSLKDIRKWTNFGSSYRLERSARLRVRLDRWAKGAECFQIILEALSMYLYLTSCKIRKDIQITLWMNLQPCCIKNVSLKTVFTVTLVHNNGDKTVVDGVIDSWQPCFYIPVGI